MKNFFENFAVEMISNDDRKLGKDCNNERFVAKMIYKGENDFKFIRKKVFFINS